MYAKKLIILWVVEKLFNNIIIYKLQYCMYNQITKCITRLRVIQKNEIIHVADKFTNNMIKNKMQYLTTLHIVK